MMFVYLQSCLIIALEVFCSKMFFEVFSEKRKYAVNWLNYLLFALLVLFDCLIVFLFSNIFIIKQVLVILIMTGFMWLYFKIKFKKSMILSVLYQGLILAIDYLLFVVINYFFYDGENALETELSASTLVVILGKLVMFICVMLLNKYIGDKSAEMLSDTEWIKFLFFPVLTIGAITAMISEFNVIENPKQANILFMIAFGLIGMNIVVFYLINDILMREKIIRENKVFEIKVLNQTKMYYTISENFDKQKKKMHEYKNQISCIESLLCRKRYKELEEYIEEINGKISKELDAINTNHVIVNSILNTKYQEATEKNIILVFKLNDLSKIKISDEDIVIILSNLLNNAIEACEKCNSKRIIKLKFVHEDENIVISVKNTYYTTLISEDGKLQTSKQENKEEHGIGIRNIIDIIEKYKGSYVIQNCNEEFYFSIMIPA